jgi:hypothetical protein
MTLLVGPSIPLPPIPPQPLQRDQGGGTILFFYIYLPCIFMEFLDPGPYEIYK